MLKVREADMALLKEVVEPARSKYQQVRQRGKLCAYRHWDACSLRLLRSNLLRGAFAKCSAAKA